MAKTIDTRENKVGQAQQHDLPATGPVGDVAADIETVDTPHWQNKAKEMAFMEEIVEVKIMATGNQNDELFVPIFNDGRPQYIMRGQWQKVKRKFVEVLARAKGEKLTTSEYRDSTGARATRINVIPSLQYPFEMRDNNPDGQVWLQRILQEA